MSGNRIGVFICHCGGNISDFVDVEGVCDAVKGLPGVKVARTNVFSCSDAAQTEMISLIKEHGLDMIVIASCSPKLHLGTFREMARRAGINPYCYNQVNIREQCSWAHTHNKDEATRKATRLVKAGIARCLNLRPLEPVVTGIHPSVLVIGAGIAGMKASLSLSRMGINVHLVEREDACGGLLRERGPIFPTGEEGRNVVARLLEEIRSAGNIDLFLGAKVLEKKGSVGDFSVRVGLKDGDTLNLQVGAIIVATGASSYTPGEGEMGYGSPLVCTLKDFLRHIEGQGPGSGLTYDGRPVNSMAYIYCVGSREIGEGGRTYCSRYCCTSAVHTASFIHDRWPGIEQYHLYQDIRTYGPYEEYYKKALEKGSVFIRYNPKRPPQVHIDGDGPVRIVVEDLLTSKEVVEIEADLLCLVTGLEPDSSRELAGILKIHVGKEGFFNEIHPKLRPVETMVDGVFICGCAQGPKTSEESAVSAMAASAKAGAMILAGEVRIEPFVAEVIGEKCDGCGACKDACPYGAIGISGEVAEVNPTLCKGEGACVPACPRQAIQVKGFEHETLESVIETLLEGYEHE